MNAPVPTPEPTESRPVAPAPAYSALLSRLPILSIITWTLIALVLILMLYPVTAAVIRAFSTSGQLDFSRLFDILSSSWLPRVFGTTLITVVAGGGIALFTASLFAWLNERTDARLGILADLLPLVPLLLPTVALAVGWIFLGSPRVGFINHWLDLTVNRLGLNLSVNIESWGGLVFVYALFFVPYVYVIVSSALRNMDGSLEEASRTSGASLWMTIRSVSLPAIKPALAGGMLLISMVGMGLYSVPAIIATRANIDILSVRIIQSIMNEYPPRTDEAVTLAGILMVFIFAVWTIHRRVTRGGHYSQISGKGNRQSVITLGAWRWPARFLMIVYLLITSILPVVALLIVSFQPFWTPLINFDSFTLSHYTRILFERQITRSALLNSITLGLLGALTGMIIAGLFALYIRAKPRLGGIVDSLTKLPSAFSHIVIGIGFLVAFSGPPFQLAGTILILFLAYLILYLPEASIAANSALSQVSNELSEASIMSGAGEGRTFWQVILPLMLPGMVSGAALVFVLILGELTASYLLAGVRFPVAGFVIIDIWESGQFGELAALATSVTLLASGIIAIVFSWLHRYRMSHGLATKSVRRRRK